MPKYDTRCTECSHEEEITRRGSEPNPPCSVCGAGTVIVWRTVPILDKAKDPYDLLDGKGQVGGGKKIFSGPSVSSKTTT
jgi:hypothetical protein